MTTCFGYYFGFLLFCFTSMVVSNYFDSDYISNSDLKKLKKYWDPRGVEPENLEDIFKEGTLNHHALLEPQLADKNHPQYIRAVQMADTMRTDSLIGPLMKIRDFRIEHEFYRLDVFGVKARCKMDGSSKLLSTILEYKGLSVSNDRAFNDAIVHFDYDMGAAWYLNVTRYKQVVIAAGCKPDTRKKFKVLIDRDHLYYKTGLEKIEKGLEIYKQLIG